VKIGFVLSRPTQFDTPFFRYASRDPDHDVLVMYTDPASRKDAVDPELGRPIDWGEDLLAGYETTVRPAEDGRAWVGECLERGPFDLLIVNGYTRRIYRQFARRSRGAGRSVGLRVDSADWGYAPRALLGRRLLLRPLLRRYFDRYFAVGSCSTRYLRAIGVPQPQIGLFPYAVDADRYRMAPDEARAARRSIRAQHGIPDDAFVVLAVAKFNWRESPWDLVRATPRLTGERVVVLIVGDGEDRAALEAEARRAGAERVRFVGYVPYAKLPDYYPAADVFVHAAHEERWGVSVHEAIAAGLPAIASDRVGAGYDLIQPGRNGFQYPHGRADLLAEAIGNVPSLDPGVLKSTNSDLVERWGYAAIWRGMLDMARGRLS
jgi:glycosyltransferase involved in cell wall biosynthesis